ncbi:MAG: DUF4190 domain-containing protein [Verrucomicrobiales bacterium]|nr:DUF4190 domain-containing protein [Verrucomicrobiales bacterium]
MAVIKIACTKCGQRVSGDESFYGTTVECPVCSSIIAFPEPIICDPPAAAPTPAAPAAATDQPASAPATSDPGMPTLGSHAGADLPSQQTTSIPLLPENIVTQDANRIGALNAAIAAEPDEEPPSTLQSVLAMVAGILGLVFFPFGAALICSPAAIILGHIALAKARHSRIQPAPGRTLALIGVILGYAGLCVILTLLATYSIWSKWVPQLSGE